MFQVYLYFGIVILSLAFSVGLISGLAIMRIWPEISDEIIYLAIGIITVILTFASIRLIYFLKKTGRIKIEKGLIKRWRGKK